jgi:hypothetical protein
VVHPVVGDVAHRDVGETAVLGDLPQPVQHALPAVIAPHGGVLPVVGVRELAVVDDRVRDGLVLQEGLRVFELASGVRLGVERDGEHVLVEDLVRDGRHRAGVDPAARGDEHAALGAVGEQPA